MAERFSTKIDRFVREQGGRKKAEKFSFNWYEANKNTNEGKMQRFSKVMEPGKIYTFQYDPKTKDRLSYYDTNPVVICLGNVKGFSNLNLGLNLNFLPYKIKIQILDFIDKNLGETVSKYVKINPENAIMQKQLAITYEAVKQSLKKVNGQFALRSYYVDRRRDTYVVSYENWPQATLLKIEDFEGIQLNQVYSKYYASMRTRDQSGRFKRNI